MMKGKSVLWILGVFAVVGSVATAYAKSTIFCNDEFAASSDSALANTQTSIAASLYQEIGLEKAGLPFETFNTAMHGFFLLKEKGQIAKAILSIADMSKPSGEKRLYIIDMDKHQLLKHTYVAHGRNSGDVMATHFSNQPSSLQSSLGFYVTAGTYEGNNGYSLRLIGQEKGFNDNALNRAVVMHGAAYVNDQMARSTGRVGRSWGCPAVPLSEHKQIIDLVKNGSCLFVFAPEKNYLANSKLAGVNQRM